MEKIWLEIICEKGKTDEEKKFFKEFLQNNCLIIGDDSYINNSTTTRDGYTYWDHELAYVTNRAVYKERKDAYKILVPYLRGISDEPTLLEPIVSGGILTNKEKQKQEPFKSINPKFFEQRPEIIIISSNSHEEILKVFNELNSIVKKHNLEPKPDIVAESNPDIQKIVMELNKAHMWVETEKPLKRLPRHIKEDQLINITSKIYYDGNKHILVFKGVMSIKERDDLLSISKDTEDTEYQDAIKWLFEKCFPPTKYPMSFLNEPYPVEFSETVVNPFRDGKNMVRGYINAMSGEAERGVVVRICVEDKLGVFTKLAFLLANLKVTNFEAIIQKNIPFPSFHNTQALTQGNDYFCFFSDADLIKDSPVVLSTDNADHIREVFVSSNKQENRKRLINNDDCLIPKKPEPKQICGSCMGLTYCSIASFERSIATEFNPENKKNKETARWKNDEVHGLPTKNKRYEKFARVSGYMLVAKVVVNLGVWQYYFTS